MVVRNKSIIQKDMTECFVCGTPVGLHIHEVFFGTDDRKKSIKCGCYVKLCYRHHTGSSAAVHSNHALDLNLKKHAQRCFEEKYGHEKFMETFHHNYLWDEEE